MRIVRSIIAGLYLLAFIASFPQAIAGEDQGIRVSINDKHQMRVPLTINGQASFGIVDTGATFPLIDSALLPSAEVREHLPNVLVQGLSGEIDFEVTSVSSIEIGADRLEAVPAGINDDSRFPGLLNVIPADAFDERVIDFDFKRGLISLYENKPISDPRIFRSRLSYKQIAELPFVRAKINGFSGLALIDTGSSATFVNSVFADKAKVKERPDLARELFGVDDAATVARIVQLRTFGLGQHRIRQFNVMVADPVLFESLGLADEPVMIIGLDVLRHFRVQIDRDFQHIWFGR
ncbi:MAG: aspartyl protease family protein [Henriciella sp.]|nr:aspartyl protease family protein [Henriciella sp.]